ncbi:MAG: hypothetical protein ACOYI9_13760 [Candidatus Hydrogenedentales bacterium]|jgi:predicted transposase/invertase (TIGR01784 family)
MAKIAAFTKEERDAYEQSVKTLRDNTNIIDYAHEEGREKGRAEGREEGRAEGRAETIIEKDREFVLRLFNRSYDTATISDLTGLSLKEVQAIIDSITN